MSRRVRDAALADEGDEAREACKRLLVGLGVRLTGLQKLFREREQPRELASVGVERRPLEGRVVDVAKRRQDGSGVGERNQKPGRGAVRQPSSPAQRRAYHGTSQQPAGDASGKAQ